MKKNQKTKNTLNANAIALGMAVQQDVQADACLYRALFLSRGSAA